MSPEEKERWLNEKIQLLAETYKQKLRSFQADEVLWKKRLNGMAEDHRMKAGHLWKVEQAWKRNIKSVAQEYTDKLGSLRSQERAMEEKLKTLSEIHERGVASLQRNEQELQCKFVSLSKDCDSKLSELIRLESRLKQGKKELATSSAYAGGWRGTTVMPTTGGWDQSTTANCLDDGEWGSSEAAKGGFEEASKEVSKEALTNANTETATPSTVIDGRATAHTTVTADSLRLAVPMAMAALREPARVSIAWLDELAAAKKRKENQRKRDQRKRKEVAKKIFAEETWKDDSGENEPAEHIPSSACSGMGVSGASAPTRPCPRGLSGSHWAETGSPPTPQMRKQTEAEPQPDIHCPLCIDQFDLSDRNFQPCPCGYRVCMFCVNRIRTMENGLCPACRTPYNDEIIQSLSKPVNLEDFRADRARQAHREGRKGKACARLPDNPSRRKTTAGAVVKGLTRVTCYKCGRFGHLASGCKAKEVN